MFPSSLSLSLSLSLYIYIYIYIYICSCYALNYVKYTLPIDILKLIYFANIQSIMSYGIIFWGASTTASKVFILQKKTLRIICNIKLRDSCRKLFSDNQIMTFYSLYLYSLTLFVVNNKGSFDPIIPFISIIPEPIKISIFLLFIWWSMPRVPM